MPVQIVVPELGESVVEATVAAWLKQEGDRVAAGDPLVRLETDKVDLEVSAERAGVLGHIERQAGEDVQVGDVLATLDESGSAPAAHTPTQTAAPVETAGPARQAEPPQPAASHAEEAQPPAEPQPEKATPVARRMAQELGVDLGQIQGSGPQGRVTKEDIETFLQPAAPSAPAAAPQPAPRTAPQPARPTQTAVQPIPAQTTLTPARDGREERQRMSRRRQTIAQRLVEAQHTAAMLTTFNEIDMSAVMEVRKRRRDSFKERHGVSLGFMSFFVKASIGALKTYPRLNAEIQGNEFVLKHYYDIGIAIGAAEGLVVPVLRDADRMSFAEIEKGIKDYARKVEEGTLSIEDLRGGTFTITNGGVFGSLMSTPILNPPQVAILGMHKIQERPVVVDGQVVVRPMMYVAVSYDHRIVDGREAVQFLVKIKELVEDPETLLLEG
jgi:2-oxoglutarate dehydrogenase E2 component (dihydrolipoamide succinyltransferase)